MTKQSVLGILLLATGLAFMMVGQETMTCVIGPAMKDCQAAGNLFLVVAGPVLILIGAALAVRGLPEHSP